MNIAIIGAGLSGSNILKNLFDNNFIEGNKIYIFEKRKHLGPGFPYEHESEFKLLNIDKKYLSMTDDENDFVKWLEKNKKKSENFENMVPRNYFGEYLEDTYKNYYDHENVKIVHKKVNDIEIITNKKISYKIKTDSWLNTEFDAVFLSIGHPDYKDFYNLKDNINYIHNPYPLNEKLSKLSEDNIIGVLGAGATSLDIFRYILQTYKLKHPLYFFSRNSIFNIPHIKLKNYNFKFSMNDSWIKKELEENKGFIPLDNIIELIDEDFKYEGIDLYQITNI